MVQRKMLKKITVIFFIFWLVLFDVKIFQEIAFAGDDDEKDYKKSIDKTSKQIKKEEKGLQKSQTKLNATQGQINTTASKIAKTEEEISRKEIEVKNLNQRIKLNREILGGYIQGIYYAGQDFLIRLFLDGAAFIDGMSGNFDQMLNTNEKVLSITKEIKKDKEDLENTKSELAEKKDEHEKLLGIKQAEKKEIVGDINETKLTIAQLQTKLNKLKRALSNFLGGSYTMDDVIEAVKKAEEKTGVRKEFLFAMLDKETDLGRFTGGCTYEKSKMGDANAKIFKSVCKELGYDYKKKKVSCPLSYGIGGAMGVAQFMPTTWVGWVSKIEATTGHNPPDPWNLTDGIMGMALKLKAAGAGKKSGEYNAAAIYYCGSRLSRTVCKNYANTVISWSKGYDDYF